MSLIDGRYKPKGAPSDGGMGSVLRCEDTFLKRDVAIKFMNPGGERRRVMDEIKALETVRSPHVVQLYDVVILPPHNQVGIVQEFIDGDDLQERAARGITEDEALHCLYQLACGLSDTHAAGVIHRDIKPNNMKIDREGVLKLFDFGLARTNGQAQTLGFRGTPGFAAPELVTSGYVAFTTAVDVYAYGATALWLVARCLPDHMQGLPPATKGDEFAALGLHPELTSCFQRCISMSPLARPPSQEVRTLLHKHLARNKHRALVSYAGTTYRLAAGVKPFTLRRSGSPDRIRIAYDEFDFVVVDVSGDVFVNNMRVLLGMKITGSCLITLGSGRDRAFVTFDVSHPEVVL